MKLLCLALTFFCLSGSGVQAPSFQSDTVDGKNFSLKDKLKAGHPVLVSFWATWCQPCLDELSQLKTRLSKGDGGVDVIAINVDTSETSSDVRPTIRLHKIEFPVILDPTHQIFSKYNATKAVPFSVLIGTSGEILGTYAGYSEEMIQKLEKLSKKKE